jgi:hypothetical protein
MPRISEFYGIIIEMYWSDHNPPHFHAKYGEHRAEIEIRTLGILKGRLPAKATGLVVEWTSLHQVERWERARQHQSLEKIDPLL